MAIALSPERRFRYILEEDRELPADQQTVWWLRVLTQKERDRLLKDTANVKGANRSPVPVMADTLRCGLDGWDNFRDAEGSDTPFEAVSPSDGHAWIKRPAIPSDATLDNIPYGYWTELFEAIINSSQLREDDVKN